MAETAIGERLERAVRERGARAAALAAVKMETSLRAAFQVHRDTGETQRSISVRLSALTPTRIEYTAKVSTPQAQWINDGTQAHGPVTARFLVFTPKGSGRTVFTKWVRGITADHWWDDTIAQWHDFLQDAITSF